LVLHLVENILAVAPVAVELTERLCFFVERSDQNRVLALEAPADAHAALVVDGTGLRKIRPAPKSFAAPGSRYQNRAVDPMTGSGLSSNRNHFA